MRRTLILAAALLILSAPATYASGISIRPAALGQGSSPRTLAQIAARLARRYRGTPYRWAGTTPAGFDCSGFTRFVYGQVGIALPHSSYAQWSAGRHVRRSRLHQGDLVFFGLGHVGLYLGHGKFIHAPHSGAVASIASLNAGWYARNYTGAVRLPTAQRAPDPYHGRRARLARLGRR